MDQDFVDQTKNKNLSRFADLFAKYGIDERSLGSTKHKNHFRYKRMLEMMNPQNGSLLDVGSGFGDLFAFLRQNRKYDAVKYHGVEFVPEFVEAAKELHPGASFEQADFLRWETKGKFDFVFQCGCFFNLAPDEEEKSYDYIDSFIRKVMSILADNGVAAIHFLTDKVDYKTSELDFHVSPERILGIAYRYSRRVLLDNGFFPFEACLILYKNDSFRKETTIFTAVEK